MTIADGLIKRRAGTDATLGRADKARERSQHCFPMQYSRLGAFVLDRQHLRHPVGVAHAIAIAVVLLIAVIGAVVLMSREAAGQRGHGPWSVAPALAGSQALVSTLVPLSPSEPGGAGGLATPTIAGRNRRSPIV